jgi:uncharacterized Zn finger protein
VKPVVLTGSAIARTWWGKSWNKNLEQYADYSNRIGRGRSYVRHGAVLDLEIDAGTIKALVQGSRSKPYEIIISIGKLNKKILDHLVTSCSGRLDSISELVAGKFHRELGELFLRPGAGLFPSPKEIDFECSCPDWASMCKHVAATLYGVGARLDEDATLFFRLRGVDMADLIGKTVSEKADTLLAMASRKSSRVIKDEDLSALFGIDMLESGGAKAAVERMKGKLKSGKTKTRKSRTAGQLRDAVSAEGKKGAAKKKVLRRPKARKKKAPLPQKKRG